LRSKTFHSCFSTVTKRERFVGIVTKISVISSLVPH